MDHQMVDQSRDNSKTTSRSTMAAADAPNSNVKVAAGYVLQERLGSGSFATVYKGIRLADYQNAINTGSGSPPPSNSIVAIKAISRSSKKLTRKVLENLDMEIAILRTYRHPNIVCLNEVQKTDRHFYLVLEYCGGGDLQRLIRTRQKGRLSERLCRRLVRDLAAGLGFLWGKELVHRDIKPQNLLLTGPLPAEDEVENPPRDDAKRALRGMTGERFMLKIADFGFARHLSGVDLAETMCGSPLYMAPEILSGEKYDAKADLWSVGAVLFEMIAGKTPFHGENHLDLLRNIKTKAVRLPANVRISREFITLLKLLLDRKPHNRAGFEDFFHASEALVALGCHGSHAVPSSMNFQKRTDTTNSELRSLHPPSSGQKIVGRDVCAQMNLCAISENEGTGESYLQGTGHGTASMATVATLGTVNHQQLQQVRQNQHVGANYVSNMVTPQTNALTGAVQVRPDHINKAGVVTPPLNPLASPQQPPALPNGQHGVDRHHSTRPSVFAPLQGSPNLSPSTATAVAPSPPPFSLGVASNDIDTLPYPSALPPPRSRPYQYHNQGNVVFQPAQQQRTIGHRALVSNQSNTLVASRRSSSPKTSSHESQYSDSGFVMVEHSGYRSNLNNGQNSPSTSIGGIAHSPSGSPHSSSGRVTILNARANMGMLGTSPRTGRALVGKMMMGSPAKSPLAPPFPSEGGKFNLSPRAALRSGGCLAHIDVLARMLAASEDIGRRAITVAHLGDVRAYLAMELLVAQSAQREESQLSSMSTGTPMEDVDEERNSETQSTSNPKSLSSRKAAEEEEGEENELRFDMTTSSENMTGSPSTNIMSNLAKSSENEKPKGEITSSMVQVHFREALICYCKTLTMMKGSICAAQKVLKDIEEVVNLPQLPSASAGNPPTRNKNPYMPLRTRCSASLDWLRGQFSAVLERADAANEQISKLQPPQMEGQADALICVEELIYNHSLKCGREGAVKQILGHYEAARTCFRTAGLLAETLLMESKVAEDDRSVLEGYVNSFADQIITLDELIQVEMRKSRTSNMHSQGGSVL